MTRKYYVECKEKAVHQIIDMVRLESYSLQLAYTEVGGGCPILCIQGLDLQVVRESIGVSYG